MTLLPVPSFLHIDFGQETEGQGALFCLSAMQPMLLALLPLYDTIPEVPHTFHHKQSL